jgi:hypothetical protein
MILLATRNDSTEVVNVDLDTSCGHSECCSNDRLPSQLTINILNHTFQGYEAEIIET